MTIGTALIFIFTGVIVLAAIVGGIWLEQRMPDPRYERIPARSPRPAGAGRPDGGPMEGEAN